MLIIEGADCTGKTTLAKKLVEKLNNRLDLHLAWTYSHLGMLPPNWDYVWDYWARMYVGIVWDRFWWSEVIYGNTLRQGSRINCRMIGVLREMSARHAAFTVMLTADAQVIAEVYRENPDRELFSLEQVLKVNAAFKENKTLIPSEKYHIGWGSTWPGANEAWMIAIIEKYVAHVKEVRGV